MTEGEETLTERRLSEAMFVWWSAPAHVSAASSKACQQK